MVVEEADVGVLVVGWGCSLRSPHIEQLGCDSGLGWAQFGQPHVDLFDLFLWPLPLFFFLGIVEFLAFSAGIYLRTSATTTGLNAAMVLCCDVLCVMVLVLLCLW